MLTKFKSVNQPGEKESVFRKMLIIKALLDLCTKNVVFIQGLRIRTFLFVFRVFLFSLFAKLRIDNRPETDSRKKSPNLASKFTHSDKETRGEKA
jgi:hypothetical protein